MRHHNTNRKFGRVKKVRKALLFALTRSLLLHGKIKTTEAKAKELRPIVEKLVTMAKKDTLPTGRLLSARLLNQVRLSKKLIEEIAPRYNERKGGYVRIMKLPRRKSDGAEMAVIEFV